MTIFLNLRVRPSGGGIRDSIAPQAVTIDPATGAPSAVDLPLDQLADAILGKNVLLATHGFNVSQTDGFQELSNWKNYLQLDDTWLFIGMVWPGDSSLLGPLCYPGEGRHAMKCGDKLARFILDNFVGANSLSLASHSLGARFVLQTVQTLRQLQPTFIVHRLIMMAGAVNHDALTTEYADAMQAVDQLALLASREDQVLSKAFPAGNIFEGILDAGHPWLQSALGRQGPKTIPPSKSLGKFQIPSNWKYDHSNYIELPKPPAVDPLPQPQDAPAEGTPQPYTPGRGESAWSAAFVATRLNS